MSKVKSSAKSINTADRAISHKAAGVRDTPWMKTLGAMSEVADQPPLIAMSLGTLVLGAVLRKPVMLRSGVRMLAAEIIATGIKDTIKGSVDRTRPKKAIESGQHRFQRGDSKNPNESSFPSGHTAGAVAVAGAIAREVPAAALPAYVTAAAVGAVQVPRGKHYVLDALVGAAIGYVANIGAGVVVRASSRLAPMAKRLLFTRTARRQNSRLADRDSSDCAASPMTSA